jgi:hypothetical protein
MRMMLFWLFLGIAGLGRAQPGIQWQKCLGGSLFEHATKVQQTKDGGFAIAGYIQSDDGDVSGNYGLFDFWVVKLDSFGSMEWEKPIGGGYFDWAYDIKQTEDDGFIVVGSTESNDGDVSGNHGDLDIWVVKLNAVGNIEWQKCLGGDGYEEGYSVELSLDGGYIVVGEAGYNNGDVTGNHGFSDFWVVKLSDSGAIEWQKCLGGSSSERALSVKPTSDGGYVVVGETQSNDGDVVGNNGDSDLWVVKLNSFGGIEWQNALGGAALDVASDIVETVDGFVVCGYVGSSNSGDVGLNQGFFDYWIIKLSQSGNLLWQKNYGGTNADYARSIIQTSDGMFIVAGEAKSNNGDVTGNNGIQVAWVVKLNGEGDLIWQKALGGADGEGCNSIQQTSDGGYVLAGYAWSNNGDVSGNHGEADFWVVKLSQESSPTTQPNTHPLNLYPNPTTQSITIQIPDIESPLNIQITDLLGRELGRQTIPNGGTVDIESLPNGVYLVSARTESGEVFLGRVCKQE